MMKLALLGLATVLIGDAVRPLAASPVERTWTGWFSDHRCAREPKPDEAIRPNGTACVKQCLLDGATPVFLSEQTDKVYKVLDHPSVREDVGFRVEVVVSVDEQAKTVALKSVKRLSEVTAMCLLPKKRS